MLVSASMGGVIAILALFPDSWELVGGRNVPLGGSAKETVDAGAFLANASSFNDDEIVQFNLAFGPVVIKRKDGLYEFSVEGAKNKDHFHFDLSILARVFGEKLGVLNLNGCEGMKGACMVHIDLTYGANNCVASGWGYEGVKISSAWVMAQGRAQRTFQETLPPLIVELS